MLEDMLKPTADRLVLSTGPRNVSTDDAPSSLTRLANHINVLIERPELVYDKKEVVVTGGWTFSKDPMDVLKMKYGSLDLENAIDTDYEEPMTSGDLTRARSQSSAAQSNTPQKHELEWAFAINLIKSLLGKIEGLSSLMWETDLPFSKEIWTVIPQRIEKLSLNLFVPDAEDRGMHDPHPEYFTHDDLKHLVNFRNLRSLRVYNMSDSFQAIIWETAWKNPRLTTLELGMRQDPITRGDDKMLAIDCNWKYNIQGIATGKYRGNEGLGLLHHSYGYGEYLDRQAIRNARNKVRNEAMLELDEVMSLTTLRLGNFVVDDTSLAEYFDNLNRVVFVDKCVDAGFVLPNHLDGKVLFFTRPQGLGELIGGIDSELQTELVTDATA